MDLLHVFTITWNNSKNLQQFIEWYRKRVPNCQITVFDNMSTDNTKEICEQYGVEHVLFDTNNQMDEQTLIELRNLCYFESDARFVIVCDDDEFVDITEQDLLDNIKNQEWTVCKCAGYEMFGTNEERVEDLEGVPSIGYCKPVLFDNKEIELMHFAAGSHTANPEGNVIWKNGWPNLYHTKWRSWEEGIERQHVLATRRSEHSKKMGWNIHYSFDDSVHKDYYENGFRNKKKIN